MLPHSSPKDYASDQERHFRYCKLFYYLLLSIGLVVQYSLPSFCQVFSVTVVTYAFSSRDTDEIPEEL